MRKSSIITSFSQSSDGPHYRGVQVSVGLDPAPSSHQRLVNFSLVMIHYRLDDINKFSLFNLLPF